MTTRTHHLKYTIELEESDFTQLLMLVMQYGTGTGEGRGTSITLRKALGTAKPSVIRTCEAESVKKESEWIK